MKNLAPAISAGRHCQCRPSDGCASQSGRAVRKGAHMEPRVNTALSAKDVMGRYYSGEGTEFERMAQRPQTVRKTTVCRPSVVKGVDKRPLPPIARFASQLWA